MARAPSPRQESLPALPSLDRFFDVSAGRPVPLRPPLSGFYGPLRLPASSTRPYVVGNFATTLDGVVSFGGPRTSSGGDITGFDPNDRLLMGLLRAISDVVVVGAGTLRAVPRHIWTSAHVYPPAAAEFASLRRRMAKPKVPLNVVVTATGRLDLSFPLFSRAEVPVLIVTTAVGARRLGPAARLPCVSVIAVRAAGRVRAKEVLRAVRAVGRHDVILLEGGPHLIGSFFAEKCLDELFLTVAPQIAGRGRTERLGLVAGRTFAPAHPRWGSLTSVRRGGNLLFLRCKFPTAGKR